MQYNAQVSLFRPVLPVPVLPLGINTEFAAAFHVPGDFGASIACRFDSETSALVPVSRSDLDLRRVRYRLQRVAHEVLGIKHRVGFCHRHLGHDSVGAHIRKSGERHSLGGLAVCGNAWVCPVCASRVARRRADEVRHSIRWAQSQGFKVELLTLTVPHGLGDSAKHLVDSVSSAWRTLTGHRRWNAKGGPRSSAGIKRVAGVHGYIRALEVTHGQAGWHPHLHIIFISERGLMLHRVQIWELWRSVTMSLGLGEPSLDHGIDIRDGEAAGEYLCKFSDDGELLNTRQGNAIRWDAADELTLANRKSGRGSSRKPHQILADAEFNKVDAVLFREFAAAFKGKSQLQWSRGLKALTGVTEKTDEEIAEDHSDTELVFVIPPAYWSQVVKAAKPASDRRSLVVKLSETGGLSAVVTFLASLTGHDPDLVRSRIQRLTLDVLNPPDV